MSDCRFFDVDDVRDKSIPNCIVIESNQTQIQQAIELNTKECQLILDKTNPEASWALLADSLYNKTAIRMTDGNWSLVAYCIDGNKRPLH